MAISGSFAFFSNLATWAGMHFFLEFLEIQFRSHKWAVIKTHMKLIFRERIGVGPKTRFWGILMKN